MNAKTHYDLLIDENDDPVHDAKPLRDYMDKWDGPVFIDKMQLNKEMHALEIGVGTGRLAVRVAPLCNRFSGIDISPKTIERAKINLNKFDNVSLICDDFLAHDFHEKFDIIYSSLTFMHIAKKENAINKVSNLLKENGKFLLSIDKNQNDYIDMGSRKLVVYPDTPEKTLSYISNARLEVAEQFETEFAHIFIAVQRHKHQEA